MVAKPYALRRATPPRRTRTRASLLPLLLVLLVLATACGGGAGDGPADGAGGTQATADAAATGEGARQDAAAPAPAQAALSPRLQGLVRSEMTHLEPAMQRLLSFIARGDTRMGARVAREVEATFVLQRAMPEEQLQQLVAEAPPEFVELDRTFHRRAGQLAQALERGDLHLASDVYSKMTRLCVECHGRYARHRFPAIAPPPEETPAGGAMEEAAEEAAGGESAGETAQGGAGPAEGS